MKDKQQTPEQAYEDSIFDVYNLLAWLEIILDDTPKKIKWPDVGSLNKVRDDLLETISFKSGYVVKSLKETLAECRLDRSSLQDAIERDKK